MFELLGFDFMIDEDMRVWLIEVNINPALHSNCKVLRDVIPPMVAETLRIPVEIFTKRTRGETILPLTSVVNCEPLFNAVNKFEFQVGKHGASKCHDAVS